MRSSSQTKMAARSSLRKVAKLARPTKLQTLRTQRHKTSLNASTPTNAAFASLDAYEWLRPRGVILGPEARNRKSNMLVSTDKRSSSLNLYDRCDYTGAYNRADVLPLALAIWWPVRPAASPGRSFGCPAGFCILVRHNSQSRLCKTNFNVRIINPYWCTGAVKFTDKRHHGQLAAIAQHFLLALLFFNLCEFENDNIRG